MPRLRPSWVALGVVAGVAVFTVAAPAAADEPSGDDVPADLSPLLLETGRRRPPAPDPEAYRFTATGELQLRLQGQRTFPMTATPSAMQAKPGLAESSHGQHWFGSQWLRLTPRFLAREDVAIVGQIDVLTGTSLGELTHGVDADRTPRNEYNGYSNVQPRWLFAQFRIPGAILRVGQQPNHWGSGIVYNDGDHPTLFGDYRYGDISERVMVAARPARDLVVSLAGDLVYRDDQAVLTRGDHAFQGIATVAWEHGYDRIGVLGTYRHQQNDDASVADATNAFVGDVHGRVARKVPGEDAFVFAESEVATVLGSTSLYRSVDRAGSSTTIASYGGLATVGYVHRTWDARPGGNLAFGDLVVQLEGGYASGDADPYDGMQRRFTFDPNHRVGLLMFDEVLRWQTARSATALLDPRLGDPARASGSRQLASNGGVFGAQYLNPTVVVRPTRRLDFKGGAVIAQSTADVVDPYRTAAFGSYQNYRGGTPKRRDLGVELDAGVEQRVALDYDLTLQLGAQAGLLFPGGALANAAGDRLPPQWLAVARVGLQF